MPSLIFKFTISWYIEWNFDPTICVYVYIIYTCLQCIAIIIIDMNHAYAKFMSFSCEATNTRYFILTLWEHRMYSIWENIAKLAFFSHVLRVYSHANLKTFYSQVRRYKPLPTECNLPIYFLVYLFFSRVVISSYKYRGQFYQFFLSFSKNFHFSTLQD